MSSTPVAVVRLADSRTPTKTAVDKIRPFDDKLTLAQLCAELQVARSTFYDWRAKGHAPPCIKLPNGDLRIRRSDLERWLVDHEEPAVG